MEYNIVPYEGINNIKYGMTQTEVETIAGKADEIIDDIVMREKREKRNDIIFIYRSEKLVTLVFSEHFMLGKHAVLLNGIPLYVNEETIIVLQQNYMDTPLKGGKNGVLFHEFGILFLGYKKSKKKNESELRCFAKERLRFHEILLDA